MALVAGHSMQRGKILDSDGYRNLRIAGAAPGLDAGDKMDTGVVRDADGYEKVRFPSGIALPSKLTTVNKAAVQSVPNITVTGVIWDSEREDTPGWWASGNPTYIQVTEAGVFMVTVQTQWADNSTANRSIHLQLNGTLGGAWVTDGQILAGNPVSTARFEQGQNLSWVGRLAANDKLSVWVYQSTGAALNFGGLNRPGGSSANSEFSVVKIGT